MKIVSLYAKQIARSVLTQTSPGYRFLLMRDHRISGPNGYPDAPWANNVLKTQGDVDKAIEQIRNLELPLMADPPKNWDSLAALDLILRNTTKDARVFDAGGEVYSVILPWLFLYGYKNLIAGNLVFRSRIKRGPIVYEYADITKTEFSPATFDIITCLSVIEHGVNLDSYFKEMSRLLRPKGILITSTDYNETPLVTAGRMAYGAPIHIFTRDEINRALATAREFGLMPIGPIDLTSQDKVVHWKEYDLHYTFIMFSLRKELDT